MRASKLTAALFALTFTVMLYGCGSSASTTESIQTTNAPTTTNQTQQTNEPADTEPSEEPQSAEAIIADDDHITVKYEKVYEADFVTGVFYLQLYATNKLDKAVTVVLENASVNQEMIPLIMTGVPFTLQPEKSGRTGFIFSYNTLSIDSIDLIENIEFDVVIRDAESFSELYRISKITLGSEYFQ